MRRVREMSAHAARVGWIALALTAGCATTSAGGTTTDPATTGPQESPSASGQWTEEDTRVFTRIVRPDDPSSPIDPWRLQPQELQRLATAVRVMRMTPLPGLRAERRALLMWLIETNQVGVSVCGDLVSGLGIPTTGDHPYLPEFMLQLGASVIELSEGAGVGVDVAETNTRAVSALADYYRAAVSAGAPRDAHLDELVTLNDNGGLRARVASVASNCMDAGVVRF